MITVTSLTDDTLANLAGDGIVSSREAMEAAHTNAVVDGSVAGDPALEQDQIVFPGDLTGAILLFAGQLSITETVTLTGLGAESTVIDAGSDVLAVPLTTDQRGLPFARSIDGDGNLTVTVDMGAYELQTLAGLPPLVVDTAVDESDGDYAPGNLSLREAIGLANVSLGFDAITFDPSLSGVPVLLARGQLDITDTVSITGLGAVRTTIDAQGLSRVLDVTNSAGDVTLHGLTITGDSVLLEDGGGIRFLSSGRLTVSHSLTEEGG